VTSFVRAENVSVLAETYPQVRMISPAAFAEQQPSNGTAPQRMASNVCRRYLDGFLDFLMCVVATSRYKPLLDSRFADILSEEEECVKKLLTRLVEDLPIDVYHSSAFHATRVLLRKFGVDTNELTLVLKKADALNAGEKGKRGYFTIAVKSAFSRPIHKTSNTRLARADL
jgi:hypothetical protein